MLEPMTMPSEPKSQPAQTGPLFDELPVPSPAQLQQTQALTAAKRSQGQPRLREPNRLQIEMRASNLDSLLAADHRARLVWAYVERQDLSQYCCFKEYFRMETTATS